MANHRRYAWLCLLLLSLTNCAVLGKVRGGANNAAADNVATLEEESTTDSDTAALRKLKHHNGRMMMRQNGNNKAKGYVTEEFAEEHHHPIDPDSEYPHPHPEVPKGGNKGGNKGGAKGGAKGGKEAVEKEAGGKEAGAKKAGAKNVGGKYKGGKEKSSTSKSEKSKKSKSIKGDKKSDKSGKKSDSDDKKGSKKGDSDDKSGKSKKGYKYHAVEKKSKSSYKDKNYVKSKEKLKKGSDSDEDDYYESDAPTNIPGGGQEPTLVEVPMTFSFAFVNPEERRRLDGHTAYEPTPEEIQTLDHAIKEYSVGLFTYLHEAKPETFYSVTPTIDQILVSPGAPYPLQVDVTFHILYNEDPVHAPTPEEVADILEDAFATDEFVHFYLWGRDDIWNNVSSVKVEANFPEGEGVPDEPIGSSGPNVEVLGTMVYDFSVDPTTEPTEADFDNLTAITQSFFTDLLTDLFKDDPDTIFEQLVVTRQATTYDLAATPPVIIDFTFLVMFADSSLIFPSSDALFDVMAANMFDSYIRLYLAPCNCFWNTVDRVGFLESESPDAPTSPPGGLLIPPQSALRFQSSMIHSFFDGTESRPSKEDYDKLMMATNVFFSETLTAYYTNITDTELLATSTEIESSFYSEDTDQPLQVDYITSVFFEGSPTTSDQAFAVLEGANYESYIMEFLWPEGEPWSNINGVMFLERIPPPEPSS